MRLLLHDFLPATAPLDRTLPAPPALVPLLLGQLRGEALATSGVHLVQRLRSRDVPSEQANGRAGEQRRTQRSRLAHLGTYDVGAGEVGQDSHDHVTVRHATVDLELLERDPGIALHAVNNSTGHVGVGLESSTGDVCGCGVRGHA